jgi:hypothetical protein
VTVVGGETEEEEDGLREGVLYSVRRKKSPTKVLAKSDLISSHRRDRFARRKRGGEVAIVPGLACPSGCSAA